MTSLSAFSEQVGGHKGTMQEDESGSILIKQTSAREIAFYQHLAPALHPDFVGDWTPKFYGTLQQQQQIPQETTEVAQEVGLDAPDALVLENLCAHFVKPSIVDFKLGKQLWDQDASPEKRQRMDQASRSTTSGSTGLRLTACQVWDRSKQAYRSTDKSYGKSLSADQLPEACTRAFPAATSYSDGSPTEGLPRDLLLTLLRLIRTRLQLYTDQVQRFPWRVYGSSLLIVYESDLDALKSTLPAATGNLDCEAEDLDDDDDDGEEEEDEEDGEKKWAFTLKAIDFAHAWEAEDGSGVDEGYNAGLQTLARLVDGRIEELEKEEGC